MLGIEDLNNPLVTTMNFYKTIEQAVRRKSTKIAVESVSGDTYSYGQLDESVSRYVCALQSLGVMAGDRVIAQLEKSVSALFLYLACLKGGYIFVPLNTAYRKDELAYFIEDAQPKLFVTSANRLEEVSGLMDAATSGRVAVLDDSLDNSIASLAAAQTGYGTAIKLRDEEVAVIVYTSGTTGRSKGAMVSHGNLISNARTLIKLWRFSDKDVLIHALPIFHVHGLFVANHCALSVGAKIHWLPKFDVDAIINILPESTVMMGVPTFYTRLLSSSRLKNNMCSNMRLFISGSAPLLSDTHKKFEEKTGHRILERYGMSEAGMITSNPYDKERKPGTVGQPLSDVEVRIVDDGDNVLASGEKGNIQVRGPNVFSGYWRMPEKTKEEFAPGNWFRTGDIGELDADGYLTIVGRSKDLVISGGYNVYPKEVEIELDANSNIAESAVFGVPHPDFGEAVTAAIVLREGCSVDADAILEDLKVKLANFKLPKRIHIVQELPRNAMGKIQKTVLRDIYKNDWGSALG